MYYIIGIIGFIILIAIIWRFSSRRHSLPCPVWLRWMVELDNPFTRINRAAVIIENAELQPGMKVLDAGCGPGRVTIPAARTVGEEGEVTAMDIQSGMLDRVKEKAAAEKLDNIRYINAGVGDGKLEKDYFDLVFLVTVLGEIPEQEKAFDEIYDVLKSDGTLSITEIIFDPHFQRQKTVEQLAASAGFQKKDIHGSRMAYTINLRKL